MVASRRLSQLKVMLGKQWLVRKRSMGQNLQLFLLPATGFLLTFFFYLSFAPYAHPSRRSTGYLELIFVPAALIMLTNLAAVNLVAEKAARLVETMKIMSLKEEVYYGAYAVENVVTGCCLSFALAVLAAATALFNGGAFFSIFAFLWCFCVACASLSCLVASVFDAAQTAGQFALALQAASVALFFVFVGPDVKTYNVSSTAQRLWCLLPHAALEFGVNSFRGSPTEDPRARPYRRQGGTYSRFAPGCDRHTHVAFSIGCPELESDFGIANFDDDSKLATDFPELAAAGWDALTYKKFYKQTQYDGIPLTQVCAMLLVDAVLFAVLAWYLGQVVPGAFGVAKPWYFPCAALNPLKRKEHGGDNARGIEFAEATSPVPDVEEGCGDLVAEPSRRTDAPTGAGKG